MMDPANDERTSENWFNLPNAVTSLRVIGSPCMVVLAALGQSQWLAVLVAFLILTEWLDGLLARALHAESAIGAQLDTVADALFYICLIVALAILAPEKISRERYWIMAAIGSYGLSWLASWMKFQRLPSYHTWMAKGAWFVVAPGVLCLLAVGIAWPLQVAMICVVLTNLEAVAITAVLPECRVDVPSLWHALASRTEAGPK